MDQDDLGNYEDCFVLFISLYFHAFSLIFPASDDTIKPLGEGGFGKVYLVRHRKTGKMYVFKLVELAQGKLPTDLEREMIMPKSFDCPFIMKVYQTLLHVGVKGVELFLQTEFCDGGDVEGVLKNCKLSNTVMSKEVSSHHCAAFFFTLSSLPFSSFLITFVKRLSLFTTCISAMLSIVTSSRRISSCTRFHPTHAVISQGKLPNSEILDSLQRFLLMIRELKHLLELGFTFPPSSS
jgi:hypothetical protein